jgi:hypothetical protein
MVTTVSIVKNKAKVIKKFIFSTLRNWLEEFNIGF